MKVTGRRMVAGNPSLRMWSSISHLVFQWVISAPRSAPPTDE